MKPKVNSHEKSHIFPLPPPFDLEASLTCGQCFGWKREGEAFIKVLGKRVFHLESHPEGIKVQLSPPGGNWQNVLRDYFRLDDDREEVYGLLEKESWGREVLERCPGLRLVRQDPWECLVSFIASAVSNIPRIEKNLATLREKTGPPLPGHRGQWRAFPTPQEILENGRPLLEKCGLGFRARYIWETAEIIDAGEVNLLALRELSYKEAKEKIKILPGVGNKIADCVLLGSLEKLEAFPIDVWIERAMASEYPPLKDQKHSVIQDFARRRWGPWAGYIQLYLYHYGRNIKNSQ